MGWKIGQSCPRARAGRGDLQRAPGIGGGDDVRRERRDVTRFARAELRGRLGLHQVVDAGAAAADLRSAGREQLDAGNRLQQRARLRRGRPARARDGRRRDRRRARAIGCRGARGSPSSTSTSETSRTFALNACARAAHAGSSANSSPYSFIADPQPAALTTMRSTPAVSKTSMLCRANARASSMRPACSASAPQQPWRPGASTLHPSAASTRTVAWFTLANDEPLHAAGQQRRPSAARVPTAGVRSAASSNEPTPRDRRRQRDRRSDATPATPAQALRDAAAGADPARASAQQRTEQQQRQPCAMRRRHGYGTSAMSSERNSAIAGGARVAPLDLRARASR